MPKWLKRQSCPHAHPMGRHFALPSPLRALVVVIVGLGLAALLAVTTLVLGSAADAHADLDRLQLRNMELERSNEALKSELALLEQQIRIERGTHEDLARQVKELSSENARMRDNAALVQAISAPGSKIDGVNVSSVRVEPNAVPGVYNYRFVLLQTGSRSKQFLGRYQLIVHLEQDGERRGISVPPAEDAASQLPFQLDFRFHRRIVGTFRVDPSASVRSVELRIFEGKQSQPKVMQMVKLS
jgi:hypothetical protein